MGWIAKTEKPQDQHPLTGTRPQLRHTWQETDTITDIGEKYGVDPEEILDFNLIEEHEINPGDELKIPSKLKAKRQGNKITYEALDHPVDMHVNKPEGIKKYAFGNVKDADQISASGHFPHGTKITIHGIAHVPVGEESLAYYMDNHAFGKYKETGKIAWNIGYAWSELTEGPYMPPEEQEPETPAPTILDEPDEPLTMFDEEPEAAPQAPEEDVSIEPEQPEDVVVPLNKDYAPRKFLFEEDIVIEEIHDRHEPIRCRKLDPVWIIGTFPHNGEEYYQPGKNWGNMMETGFLWPIPMDKVIPEDEVFDYSEKRRPMTKQEKWWELLNKGASNYNKLMVYLKTKIKEKY